MGLDFNLLFINMESLKFENILCISFELLWFWLKTQLFTMFRAEEKISPTYTMNRNRKVNHVDDGNNQ